jgi:hypothetical protein
MPFYVVVYEYAAGQVPSTGTGIIASGDDAIVRAVADAFQTKLGPRTPSEVRQLGSHPLAVVKPPAKPPAKPAAPDAPAGAPMAVGGPSAPDDPPRA